MGTQYTPRGGPRQEACLLGCPAVKVPFPRCSSRCRRRAASLPARGPLSVHTMRHHLEPGVAWQQLSGKAIVAANPWPIAAAAKQLSIRDVEFRELDDLPDDTAYVINLDQLAWMPCYRFTE